MTKKEYIEKNIGITFDFIKHLIDHPNVIDTIPNGAELDFIDKDMPLKAAGYKRKKVTRYKVEHVFEHVKG